MLLNTFYSFKHAFPQKQSLKKGQHFSGGKKKSPCTHFCRKAATVHQPEVMDGAVNGDQQHGKFRQGCMGRAVERGNCMWPILLPSSLPRELWASQDQCWATTHTQHHVLAQTAPSTQVRTKWELEGIFERVV